MSNVQRMRDLGALSTKCISFPIPPFKSQLTMCKKTERLCELKWWMIPRKEYLLDATKLMDIWTHRSYAKSHESCTSIIQTKSQHIEGEALSPSHDGVCNSLFLWKGKMVCSSGVALGISTNLWVWLHVQKELTENRLKYFMYCFVC